MIPFKLLRKIQRTKRSARKKNPVNKIFTGFFILPTVVFFFTLLVFFWSDEFLFLFNLAARENNSDSNTQDSYYSNIPNDWDTPFPTDEWQGSVPSSQITGVKGAIAMYINSISDGYYKEYLQIIKGHCDWTYMNPSVVPITVDKGGASPEKYYPPISIVLGLSMSEGGLEDVNTSISGKRIAPNTCMRSNAWQSDGKHTLYTYNSQVIREENGASLLPGMTLGLKLNPNSTVVTPQQIQERFIPVLPTGTKTVISPKYPSLLNGYGITDGTVRTGQQLDGGYFPDIVSYVIQHSIIGGTNDYRDFINFSKLSESSIWVSAFGDYNYGKSWFNPWVTGYHQREVFTPGHWNSKNTISYADNAANAVNWIDNCVESVIAGLCKDFDGCVEGLWDVASFGRWGGEINHEDYYGIALFSIFYHGGVSSTRWISEVRQRASNSSFLRGATIAYRALTGNKSLTTEDTRAWFQNNLKSVDLTKNYPGCAGSSSRELYVYHINDDYTIITDDGQRTVHPLSSYSTDVRGLFIWRIGGYVLYYRMLLFSGVECTFGDACADANGYRLIDTSGFPGDSYYYGTRPIGNFRAGKDGAALDTLVKMTSAMHVRSLSNSLGIHYGEDFASPTGTEFLAIMDGKVTYSGWAGSAGNMITIVVTQTADEKESGAPTLEYKYMHLSSRKVKTGETVKQGQVIGLCGSTGNSTGPHMHLGLFSCEVGGGKKYALPYRAIFEGKCTPYSAPRVINGSKMDKGYVYGSNTSTPLGTLTDNKTDDQRINATIKSQNGYYQMGLMKFLDEAISQASSMSGR